MAKNDIFNIYQYRIWNDNKNDRILYTYIVINVFLRGVTMVQDEIVVPVINDENTAGLDDLEEVVDGSLVIL